MHDPTAAVVITRRERFAFALEAFAASLLASTSKVRRQRESELRRIGTALRRARTAWRAYA
jgi:hypothetical protein